MAREFVKNGCLCFIHLKAIRSPEMENAVCKAEKFLIRFEQDITH